MILKFIMGLWYFFPAIVANMSPIVARILLKDKFSTPVDLNKKFMGKPLFGRTKTHRGFVAGIITGILVAYLQVKYSQNPTLLSISLIDYSSINFLHWGFLMGFGALLGDLIKSFFKRRMNIKSSRPWVPFDQIDSPLGALLLTFWFYVPPIDVLLILLLPYPLLHIGFSYTMYKLKLRQTKY